MEKTLLNSQDCYEGYDIKNEEYILGSYSHLCKNEYIDISSIKWSQLCWDDNEQYFYNTIKDEILRYEKRYNTIVLQIALVGKQEFWNGSNIGGSIVNIENMLSILSSDITDVNIFLEKDRTILIEGCHHDGTHKLYIFFLTKNNMKRIGIYNNYENEKYDYKYFEKIFLSLNPLKLSKNSNYYNLKSYIS